VSAALEIARRRLGAQRLVSPPSALPQVIVSRLGAVQAQDYGAAKWGVGLRGRGLVDADVERAFNAGEIVRTHILRPTWHFVAASDLRWLLQLTAPRVHLVNGWYYRQAGIDRGVIRRSTALIESALRGGNYRTRAELGSMLQRGRIDTTNGTRLGYLLMRAELDGLICSGPLRGKQHTYALVEERVPHSAIPARDEGLHELARRYVRTRGPVTAHDFAWFGGFTVAEARRGLESLGRGVERLSLDGRDYWAAGNEQVEPATARTRMTRTAHLLPNYDEYFIGYRDRAAFLQRLESERLPMPTPALERHLIALGGQFVGGWKRTITRTSVVVALAIVAKLGTQEHQAIARAVSAYGEFLQLPVEVRP
jgi:hypothetical protein